MLLLLLLLFSAEEEPDVALYEENILLDEKALAEEDALLDQKPLAEEDILLEENVLAEKDVCSPLSTCTAASIAPPTFRVRRLKRRVARISGVSAPDKALEAAGANGSSIQANFRSRRDGVGPPLGSDDDVDPSLPF